ncbi:MAG: hypothetical protein ACM3PS_01465 [Syntrophothermus sp.]
MKISWSIITFWKLTPSRNTPQIRAEDRSTPRIVTAVRFLFSRRYFRVYVVRMFMPVLPRHA